MKENVPLVFPVTAARLPIVVAAGGREENQAGREGGRGGGRQAGKHACGRA